MTYEFPCPWCGCDSKLLGAQRGPWRFRVPCDKCTHDIVVTFDGALTVGKAGTSLERTEDATVPFQTTRAG